jgi:hypothetical protein
MEECMDGVLSIVEIILLAVVIFLPEVDKTRLSLADRRKLNLSWVLTVLALAAHSAGRAIIRWG